MSSVLRTSLLSILLLCLSSFLTASSASFAVTARLSCSPPPPSPPCKAIPETADWPSTASWARLNESTGGRLLRPPPPGAVCHPGQATYNATECPLVQSGWSTYDFHQADPVSTDWNQWNNDSCLPQEGYQCSGQGYPVFVVNATTAQHVKLGVDFARKHNIRLAVKSSGHDFLGRSAAPNSLSIWVHHLKDRLKTHDALTPKHCNFTINTTAVTAPGGTQMIELYSALAALNQTVVGGGGRTVSVGGYLTGGGHSLLSARYGLAADQVLEMEVVTPTGEIVTANECQNQDLFWAMRGGGGSTFGILTSVTMKTFPSPQIVNLEFIIVTGNIGSPSIFEMIAYVLGQFPSLGDQGLAGYSFFFPALSNPLEGGGNGTVAGILLSVVLQDSTVDAMDKLWEPIIEHVNSTWPSEFVFIYNVTTFPSFYDWYQVHYDTSAAGLNTYIGSRLLDAEALTRNLTLNADVFRRFASGGMGTAYLVAGKGVHDAEPRGGGNAVCPAWRKAYVHATFEVQFAPLDVPARAEALERVRHYLEPLRKLSPDSGAYMNEADPEEPDWQHQFWGDNYERLVRIKRAVDPDDVLWCTPCVGNERWQQVGDRLCRV
ncbi:6-hydroxy-D-nicotine oxidase [Diplogelasinospora grovesii]|uniref:6-hydroxy-D-nicotine oxidase n=1 Tax=Diplogelasinospora grovesii TaxID=303347 RepID=A0AAN6NCU4_9PEZI|nr:6-hydroxy-D-nicotine oxidase [Diplogelasinospora grovesii]